MTSHRATLLFVVSLAIVGGSYLSVRLGAPDRQPPEHVTLGLEDSLPGSGGSSTDELIEFWVRRVERSPQDYISLTYLGKAFVENARATGDARTYDRAEEALREALNLNPSYEPALGYLAVVRFARHDFPGALELAERVYSFDSGAVQALATIGDANLEMGNYAEAEEVYLELAERSPSPPVYARLSRLAWLNGNVDVALEYMTRATDEAADLDLRGESVAWYELQLGELYFSMGQLDSAAEHLNAALDLLEGYSPAAAALGKVRAAQGRYEKAIDLYERAVAIVPQPRFLAELGDLYAITGQLDKARLQYETVEVISKLAAINRQVYNRQLAMFYADHDLKLDEALNLAAAELEVRKDVYGHDAVAWALFKRSRFEEAAEAIDRAMALGTQDAILYFHAGMIHHRLGNQDLASEYLARALGLNPEFSVLYADRARRALADIRGDLAWAGSAGATVR